MVTHGGRDLALATLGSARERAGEVDVEWFAVDSGSEDGTPEAIERGHPDVQVIRCENIGFAASNNVALRLARGRYVLLLNPDVEVLRGTLAELVAALDARPEVGMASVIQRGPDGDVLPTIRRFPTAARQLGEALGAARIAPLRRFQEPEAARAAYERDTPADWLVGAFLVARAAALGTVGPLDERFFLYSEETDWCYRMKEAGWQIRHLPVMEVLHYGGSYPSPELTAQLSYSKLLFAAKHLGAGQRTALRAALVLRHALRAVLFAPLCAVRPAARSRIRAERLALAVALGRYRPSLG